jgi:heptosyltransferase-2
MSTRLLIVPKGFFGDMVLTTPVVEALRDSEPDAHIAVLCPPAGADLFRSDPLINEVIIFDRRGAQRGFRGLLSLARLLRRGRFHRAYSFQRSWRTSLLLWLAGIKDRVGYTDAYGAFLYRRTVERTAAQHEVVRNWELVLPDLRTETKAKIECATSGKFENRFGKLRVALPPLGQLSERVREVISDSRPYILLAPGSAWATKRWDAAGFRDVARAAIQRGSRVVVIGSKGDCEVCGEVSADLPVINVCGETTMDELIAIVGHCQCLVCNDSLALHLASALERPTVAVFCATSPAFGFGPWGNRAVVIERHDLFCKPCRRHGSDRCPTGTRACMTGVSSRDVLRAVEQFVREQGAWQGTSGLRLGAGELRTGT